MQGKRGIIGSLPETLNFDRGSTSSNAAVDQQICWNNMQHPLENRLPEYMLSPADMNITYANSSSHERQDLNGWSIGEPSSSGTQNEVGRDERKTEHGWPSSVGPYVGAGPRLEERRYEQSNILSPDSDNANPLFVQSSNTEAIPQNLNLNAGFGGHGDDNCQVVESSNLFKSSGSEIERVPPTSGPESYVLPSGSGGYLMEENDGRPGSFEGRRASCKRKAIEGNVGQSSLGGSCSHFQRPESSVWPAVPAPNNASNSLSISAPAEPANPRLGLGVRVLPSDSIPDSTTGGSVERPQRNFRVRINPSDQQESNPPMLFSMGSAVRHSGISSSQQLSRLLPVDHSLDLRSAQVADNMSPQSQSAAIHAPALPRNMHSFRWNGGSSSRSGSSSSSNISRNREAVPHEDGSSRSLARNILEHPMFVPAPELRNLVRNPTDRNLANGNISIPGNVASTSRTGSSAGVHPSSAPTWGPQPNPPQYPRRFSEYVRRSLFSSLGAESGGQSSNQSPLRSGPPASSEEMVHSAGAGNQGRHHSYPRSASWMERQGDGVLGIPHSLRTLAAGNEGRSRLVVSEIRNVLDLMRRGESLRFEDVMILDQSVFFGVADMHDRHRDMRLDVDNMSYEELLALEERIGNVSTGLSEETILNQLKQRKCAIAMGVQQEAEPCCICQEEYVDGEDLGTLQCGHDFHAGCIKQWLMHKNLCPICKTTALPT